MGGAEGGPEEMRDHTASPRWAFVNKSGKAQGPDLLAEDPDFLKNSYRTKHAQRKPRKERELLRRTRWLAAESCSRALRRAYVGLLCLYGFVPV